MGRGSLLSLSRLGGKWCGVSEVFGASCFRQSILATFIQAHAAQFHCPELLLIANVPGATFFRETPQFGGGTDRLGQAHDECCQKGKLGIERKERHRSPRYIECSIRRWKRAVSFR